jgi:hypothetical protein
MSLHLPVNFPGVPCPYTAFDSANIKAGTLDRSLRPETVVLISSYARSHHPQKNATAKKGKDWPPIFLEQMMLKFLPQAFPNTDCVARYVIHPKPLPSIPPLIAI